MKNKVSIVFDAISENEGLARVVAASFAANLNPTLEEISDIKTAVSEAVTNAIVHGYDNAEGRVTMNMISDNEKLYIEIIDTGCGIEDTKKAMEPMFTTKPEQKRTGMGFVFMEVFMDELTVESKLGEGTKTKMVKTILWNKKL